MDYSCQIFARVSIKVPMAVEPLFMLKPYQMLQLLIWYYMETEYLKVAVIVIVDECIVLLF